MMRHKRKIGKLRGTRTVSAGNSGNRRGRGSRMCRGSVKSKGGGARNIMHIYKYEPERLHQPGFHSLAKIKKTINLKDLEKLTTDTTIDISKLGYQKVLGAGNITKALTIKADYFTQKARQKIEQAGGKAEVLREAQ